ncbi:MAG: hypothetical protein WC314_17410, partial [Vulcanimicrobiota bacterium]
RGGKSAFKRGYQPVSSEVWLRTGSRHAVVISLGEGAGPELKPYVRHESRRTSLKPIQAPHWLHFSSQVRRFFVSWVPI